MAYNKAEYDKQYAKEHIKRKFIPFNVGNADDLELLAWLATKDNVTVYVKQLIRTDMDKNKSDS